MAEKPALTIEHGTLRFTGGREVINAQACERLGIDGDADTDGVSGIAPWACVRVSRDPVMRMTATRDRQLRQDTLRSVIKCASSLPKQ